MPIHLLDKLCVRGVAKQAREGMGGEQTYDLMRLPTSLISKYCGTKPVDELLEAAAVAMICLLFLSALLFGILPDLI